MSETEIGMRYVNPELSIDISTDHESHFSLEHESDGNEQRHSRNTCPTGQFKSNEVKSTVVY